MLKLCKCGETMEIRLRTVIYSNKVEIGHVPVFTCEECQNCEVYPSVKPLLTGLIGSLGSKPDKQQVNFEEISEISYLMRQAAEQDIDHDRLAGLMQERVNELLDLLLLAQSLGETEWMNDLRNRLSQVTEHMSRAENIA